nr:MAG TPA: hypothetical protein [Caudoviricetes sp.]
MGGRGGSSQLSGKEPAGRKMSLSRFLQNLKESEKEEILNSLSNLSLKAGEANFFVNGNAVEFQEAVAESGTDKVSIRFYNQWNPIQVAKPTQAVKQSIEAVYYRNGNAVAVRKIDEKSSKSLKNAEKNYREMLDKWKKLTRQKDIYLR